MNGSRWLLAALLALASPLGEAAAQAPEPVVSDPQQDAGREKYKAAKQLFDEGRYEEALARFREVIALLGSSPNARLYAARCLDALGRVPDAYDEMALTVREATERAASEARFAETRDAAIQELGELEKRVGRVSLLLGAEPQEVHVFVAGREVAFDRLATPVTVMPGAVHVSATAEGRKDFDVDLTVAPGSIATVQVVLRSDASEPIAPEPAPAVAESGFGVREGGYIVAGVGVVGLVVFAAAGVAADEAFDEVSAACGGQHCPDDSHADRIDEGRRLDVAANVGLAVGIAGATAAVLMIALGGDDDEQALVAPSANGIRVRF